MSSRASSSAETTRTISALVRNFDEESQNRNTHVWDRKAFLCEFYLFRAARPSAWLIFSPSTKVNIDFGRTHFTTKCKATDNRSPHVCMFMRNACSFAESVNQASARASVSWARLAVIPGVLFVLPFDIIELAHELAARPESPQSIAILNSTLSGNDPVNVTRHEPAGEVRYARRSPYRRRNGVRSECASWKVAL